MTSVMFFYQVFGVHVLFRLPRVIRRWIALPFYQVLESALMSVMLVIDDCLYFVFLRIFDQIRRWTFEIGTVSSCLLIGQQEGRVEDIVNSPRQGEREPIGHRRD